MVRSAGAYRCVALDHVGFELTAPPSLIEQGRKKYSSLLRHYARQVHHVSQAAAPFGTPAPLAQAV